MGRAAAFIQKTICCSLLVFSGLFSMQAQSLVCDDQVNVSLGDPCEAEITIDMILEGPIDPAGMYSLEIEGVTGTSVSAPGVYTVTVNDLSNGNSCWGHILVEDKLINDPICDCPVGNTDPDCVLPPLLCSDVKDIELLTIDPPTIVDNCLSADDFDVQYTDQFNGDDCEDNKVIRTWVFTDPYGNQVTCQSEYTISVVGLTLDEGDMVTGGITPPHNPVNLDCGAGTTPEEIYDYFYETFPPCTLPSCLDADDPAHDDAIAAWESERVLFANRCAFPTIDGHPIYGVICNTVTSYSDRVIPVCSTEPGCSGNAKIIREWTIYDWCDPLGTPVAFSQVIKAQDNTPPSIHVEGFTTSVDPWGCSTKVVFPEPIHLTDNCTDNISYVVTGSGSTDVYDIHYDPTVGYYIDELPVGQHTFFYNAYDCCDNVASEGVVVTVKDATPPVAITKQDIVVSLIPNPGNTIEPGLTKIFAENVDNGSFDGCGPVKLEIRREEEYCGFLNNLTFNDDMHPNDDTLDLDEGKYVTFCCNDLAELGQDSDGDGINDFAQIKVWLRVWDDGDRDGTFGSAGDNYSEVWSYVRLEDKSRPTIVCPGDVTIDCDSDSGDLTLTGEAYAVSSCGSAGVYYEDIDRDLTNCNEGVITRRWYVDGNPAIFCDQKITLSGTLYTGPIEVFFPADTLIDCTEDLENIRPYWSSGRCDLLAYSVDRDTFFFADGACFKILNYWTVIDWCVYNPDVANSPGIWSDVQVVKVIDNDAPILTSCNDASFPVEADCKNGAVMLTNSAEDLGVCNSQKLLWTVQVDINSDWIIDYTFSSTAPSSSPFYVPPSDSGEEVKVTLPEEVHGSMVNHRVVWKVTDGCGNNTSCTSYFMVVDQIPPTPYCVNLSTALMQNGQVELWACDFDLGAFDNCTAQEDLRFTFSDVNPADDPSYLPDTKCSSMIFTCEDLSNPAGTVVELKVYVWDEKDNFDYCTVFLTLVDNQDSCDDVGAFPRADIGGYVENEMGEIVEDVMMEIISPQPNYPESQMTDNSGHYMFDNNKFDFNYQVSGHRDNDYLNGVSTLDIIVIQRHILGLQTLDSPFKMVAADVNNDESISAIDLIELRKLILGIYDDLPNNTSWKMVDASTIVDPLNPWPVSEVRIINSLSQNMMQENFVGVKVGDVNNTATANAQQTTIDRRSADVLELQFTNATYAEGDLVTMTLSNASVSNLTGLQFTLNAFGLELVEVKGENIFVDESNFAKLSNTTTTFSLNSDRILENELISLTFKATSSGKLSDNVAISSEITKAEAYSLNSNEIIPVKLAGRNNPEQDYALFQNNPNPFSGQTNIDFTLPQQDQATISVMDVNGKVLWSMQNVFDKGLNTITIDEELLPVSGILYYRLDSGDFTATKKMIKID